MAGQPLGETQLDRRPGPPSREQGEARLPYLRKRNRGELGQSAPVGGSSARSGSRRRRATRLEEDGGIDSLNADRCALAVMARYRHQPDIQQALAFLPCTHVRGVRWRLTKLRNQLPILRPSTL